VKFETSTRTVTPGPFTTAPSAGSTILIVGVA
jgi:hypothetical protein